MLPKRKLLLLTGSALLLLLAAWLFGAFNETTTDDAKYQRLQGIAQTCRRLDRMNQWLPPRISTFIRLHDFRNREIVKHDLLRIELLTSGYLTNVSFEVTNNPVTKQRLLADFSKVFKSGLWTFGLTFQQVQAPWTGNRELVTLTCRTKDLALWEQVISGDSNAPAKPIQQQITPLFEGDVPGSRGSGF